MEYSIIFSVDCEIDEPLSKYYPARSVRVL